MSETVQNLLSKMNIKLFMDGANIEEMKAGYKAGIVSGFTTNPTLMRKAKISDYAGFAKEVLAEIPDMPISFEVFSDDLDEMEREARIIASWGSNTNIKIPITNTRRESCLPMIRRLADDGHALNVTALFSLSQIRGVSEALNPKVPSIVSVFAGRIADTGIDPVPLMREAHNILKDNAKAELLWASPRELLNLFQAEECGCHIITATNDLISKIVHVGKDLEDFSLETVEMFYNDAVAAGYKI